MAKGYRILSAAVAAGATLVIPAAAPAATITSATSYTTVTNVGVGQTLGTAGYWLPLTTTDAAGTGAETTYSAYPSYVTAVTVVTASPADNGYAAITLHPNSSSSLSLYSGAYYQTSSSGARTMATITLTGTVPSFQLGIMTDNGNGPDPSSFSIIDNNGGAGTTTESGPSAYDVDDFFLIDISGASAGDVISIVGTGYNSNRYALLGGLTFDPIATPEPASLALLPLLSLQCLRRRRRMPAHQ